MADDLKVLKRERGSIRSWLTKAKDETNPNRLVLEDKINRLTELDTKVKANLQADEAITDDALTKEFDEQEKYREIYLTLMSRIIDLDRKQKSDTKRKTSKKKKDDSTDESSDDDKENSKKKKGSSHGARKTMDLPKVKLVSFDGAIGKWLGFWESFSKIDRDDKMETVDKIGYLKEALKGRAKTFIDAYPASAANYPKIIEKLTRRFGRPRRLIDFYMRELIDLVAKRLRNGEVNLISFYDKLNGCINNLESLGLAAHNHSCVIVPLIEASLPVDVLRDWEKEKKQIERGLKESVSNSRLNEAELDQDDDDQNEPDLLTDLLDFIDRLVDTEEVVLQQNSTQPNGDRGRIRRSGRQETAVSTEQVETARDLANVTNSQVACAFCSKAHLTQDCVQAQQKSLDERKEILKKKGACFICLKIGHTHRDCPTFIRCIICNRRHYVILCPEITGRTCSESEPTAKMNTGPDRNHGDRTWAKKGNLSRGNYSKETDGKSNDDQKDERTAARKDDRKPDRGVSNFVAENERTEILLQTLQARLLTPNGKAVVRILLDSGSSFSYILQSTATRLRLPRVGQRKMVHDLFGGIETAPVTHNEYIVNLQNLFTNENVSIRVLSQSKLCGKVERLHNPDILIFFEERNVKISDYGPEAGEIELLIGSDNLNQLYTGCIQSIDRNLKAYETVLGWTIAGEVRQKAVSNLNHTLVNHSEEEYWDLEVLGILDPVKQKTQAEQDFEMLQEFRSSTVIDDEGRYDVRLPFEPGYLSIDTNYSSAFRRLERTSDNLVKADKFDEYDAILREWEREGFIEEISPLDEQRHYIPHRPVYKEESLTTKTRPVFDASNKDRHGMSLNDFLKKGPNLISVIPNLLLKFRSQGTGIIADIKKAFLQISVNEADRTFLSFLWWKDADRKQLKFYRHKRVVFGLKCSPFLLGATIDFHLRRIGNIHADRLLDSFYVDNLITSLKSRNEIETFIKNTDHIMNQGKMELQAWAYTNQPQIGNASETASVLGLTWNTTTDTLNATITIKQLNPANLTKRQVLSVSQSIFDPIGMTCPVTILPKLVLREAWKQNLKWDDNLPENERERFFKWYKNLSDLNLCKINRHLFQNDFSEADIHVFVDGSQYAYAACIFLRSVNCYDVRVELVMAKSRITPGKTEITIPRVELMAATIGARLYSTIKKDTTLKPLRAYFWSDSMVVLCWIRVDKPYTPFVQNRVKGILSATGRDAWRHVPGTENPADLLSRGCDASRLLETKWWLGPQWLYSRDTDAWPQDKSVEIDDEVDKEIRHSACNFTAAKLEGRLLDKLKESENFTEAVRMTAYLLRFYDSNRSSDILTNEEIRRAEMKLLLLIQKENFSEIIHDVENASFTNLTIVKDENGLLRVKSRLTLIDEEPDYTYPVLLNGNNDLVRKLIYETHIGMKHGGVLLCMVELRKKFWILKSRQIIKKIVRTCFRCQRFRAKPLTTPAAPLPKFRLTASTVFENVGIDCAGPLYVKDGSKVWMLLFTCAVYRAVHIEVLPNMTTESCLLAIRRFIARRGRMSKIVSDNGTNFVGSNNKLKEIDWTRIKQDVGRIEWTFIPPASPWWGGFWERLIGVIKNVLKINLGRAKLGLDELTTLITECEAIVNSRPLTYIEDFEGITPLTPAMLINNVLQIETPDFDSIDRDHLLEDFRFAQRLRENIRNRFRQEYIGILMEHAQVRNKNVKVGDAVLVGSDRDKRLRWPIGRVMEIYPGADGQERVAKVRIQGRDRIRPFQRLYPLEIEKIHEEMELGKDEPEDKPQTNQGSQDSEPEKRMSQVSSDSDEPTEPTRQSDKRMTKEKEIRMTRSGRVVKTPKRFND